MYYAFHPWSLGLNPLRKGFSFRFLEGHEYFTHGKGESEALILCPEEDGRHPIAVWH